VVTADRRGRRARESPAGLSTGRSRFFGPQYVRQLRSDGKESAVSVLGRSIDDLLAEARERIRRLHPAEAAERVAAGALLVDTRPAAQRAEQGEIPGALLIERNVLEWRLDPRSATRLPEATGLDVEVIVLCSEGYSSSLAADSLRALGLTRSADVIGGFRAWAAAGLPVVPPDMLGP
jgi:rhodanese-related sulfurtransferase